MIGRLIERLFVQVSADLSSLSGELQRGVSTTQTATNQMAKQWAIVSRELDAYEADLRQGIITQSQFMSQTNKLVSDMRDVGMSYRQAQKDVWGYVAELRKAQAAQAVVADPTPLMAFSRSAGQARMQMMNLGYQLNDIGMTLATGMNPMTVMIQQGSQIAQIYGGQGGVKAALGDLSGLLRGLGARLWPLAVLAGGFALLQREINKTSETQVSFMDTTKAVFQVLGRYIWEYIEGPVKGLQQAWNAVLDWIVEAFTIFMNNVIRGGVRLVRILGETWELLPHLWHDTMTGIKNTTVDVVEAVINFFRVDFVNGVVWAINKAIQTFDFGYKSIAIIWEQFPAIMQQAMAGAVNFIIDGVENMVNVAVTGINKMIEGLQGLIDFVGADKALELFGFSGDLPTLSEADLSQWRMEMNNGIGDTMARVGAQAAESFNTNFMEGIEGQAISLQDNKGVYRNAFGELGRRITEIMDETRGMDFMGTFFDDVKAQAIENALARVAKGTEDVGTAAKKAAEEVKTLMETLDEELTKAAENLAGVFGNAFERLAETGRFTFSDFVQDLNKLIIKSTSEILQAELANMFKSLATSQGGLGSFFSNIFTNLFGGGGFNAFGARARGGVEMPWRNFIAGEEGAELISQDGPSGARRVMTAGRTRHAMSGSGGAAPQINMYISTPDVNSFQKSQSQLASRMSMFMARGQRNQ